MMKRSFQILGLFLALVGIGALVHNYAQAQVSVNNVQGPNFSLNNSVFPNNVFPVATVTGAGSVTYNIPSVSCVSIRVSGTFTVSNIAIQVSNDNSNFTAIKLLPLGTAGATSTANVSAIVAPGFFSANVGAMTQIKVVQTGAITGTSAIVRIVGSSNGCVAYAGIN